MSGYYSTNSWRASNSDQSRRHNNYNWTPMHRQNDHRPKKDWDDINNRADDQIAPKHVSESIGDLQRWALATADFPQQGHRYNESQIIDRIQRRYESSEPNHNAPIPRYSNTSQNEQPGFENRKLYEDAMKRRRSISPPLSGRAQQGGVSAVAFLREAKRRRTRSPSPRFAGRRRDEEYSRSTIDVVEDDEYAQSSEWSFPASQEQQEITDLT